MWQPHFLLYLIPEFDRRNIIYFVFLLYAFVRHCIIQGVISGVVMVIGMQYAFQLNKPHKKKKPGKQKLSGRKRIYFSSIRLAYTRQQAAEGGQLICNEPFLRILARLNIQNTDFVFVRHCNNSFFDNKNTAVSGDTAGGNKYEVSGSLCVRRGRLTGGHLRRHKPSPIFKP